MPLQLTIEELPPEVMRRIMVWLGCTSFTTILCLQLVCRGWLQAADGEMWRDLLLALCGREIVDMAAKLNKVRTTTKTYHKDICFNLAYFGDEAVVVDIGRGYSKVGQAGLGAIFEPEPQVVQICQPNADCDLEDMLDLVEQRLECNLGNTSVVMTVPFGLSGADHHAIRSQLGSLPQLQHCRAVYFVEAAPCVLLAHGLVTGVVCSIGFGQTFVVPVVEGRVISDAAVASRLGGMSLTQRMQQLVVQELGDAVDFHEVQHLLDLPLITYCRNLKEQHCYVLPRPARLGVESVRPPVQIRIPGAGGQTAMQLSLQHACYECPEMLFDADNGLGSLIWEAVSAATQGQPELQHEMLQSIVLNGGSSQMPGLPERVRYEVTKSLPEECGPAEVRVRGGDCGDKTPWRGAVRLALATPHIHSANSIPQSLIFHQCSARHCTAGCTADGGPLKICSKCKNARYCSEEHQKAHWQQHKWECLDPAEAAAKRAERATRSTVAAPELALNQAEMQQLLELQMAAQAGPMDSSEDEWQLGPVQGSDSDSESESLSECAEDSDDDNGDLYN